MRSIIYLFVWFPVLLCGQTYSEEEEKFAVVYLSFTDERPSADQITERIFQNQKEDIKSNYQKEAFTTQEAAKFNQVQRQFQKEKDKLLERLCQQHQLSLASYHKIYDKMTKDIAYQNRMGTLLQLTAQQIRPK
jgi:histidinol phosphatase-like enzyme